MDPRSQGLLDSGISQMPSSTLSQDSNHWVPADQGAKLRIVTTASMKVYVKALVISDWSLYSADRGSKQHPVLPEAFISQRNQRMKEHAKVEKND